VTDEESQTLLHEAIAPALVGSGALKDDDLVTGWVLSYEFMRDGQMAAGRVYGPAGMTTWRALGLSEYMHRTDGFREGYEGAQPIDEDGDEE